MPSKTMSPPNSLAAALPWTNSPLITSAPMRTAALVDLALAVSRAGGLGFIGAGYELDKLDSWLADTQNRLSNDPIPGADPKASLPVGVGIITFATKPDLLVAAITPSTANGFRAPPAAIWLFAPNDPADLGEWVDAIRGMDVQAGQRRPEVWVQAGSLAEAVPSVLATHPETLVVQGADAGGHGLAQGASLIPLFPETADAMQLLHSRGEIPFVPRLIATGGIVEGRGVAAAMALGAEGVCLGTVYLATPESTITQGYREELVRASDGGTTTVRSRVYDALRGTDGWPARFGGRGVTNESWKDWERTGLDGMRDNKKKYEEAMKLGDAGWGPEGRMTTYAGTGVGLIESIRPAADVTRQVRDEANKVLARIGGLQ